jgi:NAD(P)H-hydrate epimerase
MDGPVLSRAAVRELDRRTIEEFGLPSLVLMENAGRACADEALRMLGPGSQAGPALVLCGPGNNGGDGLVLARTLENRGRAARVAFVGRREQLAGLRGDACTNLELWQRVGGGVELVDGPQRHAWLMDALARAPLVVDALFGTGLARALGEPWREVIELLNASARPVLAVDLPSGLDADSGEVLGAAVRAACTVTLVARKPGLGRGRGPGLCGRVLVAEIGIPRRYIEEAARAV